jgi:hypothetical protein
LSYYVLQGADTAKPREVLDIMVVKERVRGKEMQKESVLGAASKAAKAGTGLNGQNAVKSKPADQERQVNYVAKTITVRDDQLDDVTSLAAYNKLKRRDPDTVSGVIRDALDMYIAQADDSYRYI